MRALIVAFLFLPVAAVAQGQQQQVPPDPRLCPTELTNAQGDFVNLYRALQSATAQAQILSGDKAALEKEVADLKKQLADAKTSPAKPPAPAKK